MAEASRAEVCVVACAEAWRGDGEILASPMGLIPTIGCRLAKLTFAPDLLISDGEAYLFGEVPLAGPEATVPVIEGWLPYRAVFDVVASGRRHVMMGASQLDRSGNSNISCIGDWAKPKAQLLGVRGAPGNTVNHATSYWVPRHSRRVFVPAVDMVSGIGASRARAAGAAASRFHDLRVVVTDKAVFDTGGPDGALRLRSVHPGVTVEEVQEATGFDIDTAGVGVTRLPTAEELTLIRTALDPDRRRDSEVPS
jgi:acyl CoA:acetate/3-ketoacid CoA transferase beta subunit